MLIKLKMKADGSELNLNVNHLLGFAPEGVPGSDTAHTKVRMSDGSTFEVADSTRSIRGYVKKAMFAMHTGGGDDASDTANAPNPA